MLRIEFERLMEYLLTGDEPPLVRKTLPAQRNAPELLARARVAIELLGAGRADQGVMQRLEALERAVSPKPELLDLSFLRRPSPDTPGKASRAAAAAIGQAARTGASRILRLGEVVLDKPRITSPDDGPIFANEPPLASPSYRSLAEDRSRAYVGSVPSPGRGHFHLDAGQDEALELWHEDRDGADVLMVHVQGGAAVSPALTVTWLPDQGQPVTTVTDGAGIAELPWPEPGEGVLRIDARRTFTIKVLVRV